MKSLFRLLNRSGIERCYIQSLFSGIDAIRFIQWNKCALFRGRVQSIQWNKTHLWGAIEKLYSKVGYNLFNGINGFIQLDRFIQWNKVGHGGVI